MVLMQPLPDDDCFAIRQAARFVSQLYDRHLMPVGLTITQFSIMNKLRRAGHMTMKQLTDAMVMERTTLVRALQPLQRAGLLTSLSARSRGRGLTYSLTPDGEARFAAARDCWRAAQDEFERRFGEARATSLRQELFEMTKA